VDVGLIHPGTFVQRVYSCLSRLVQSLEDILEHTGLTPKEYEKQCIQNLLDRFWAVEVGAEAVAEVAEVEVEVV
jgi:hypothetical protein